MSFILPVMASLALAIPAFAQTSPPPATSQLCRINPPRHLRRSRRQRQQPTRRWQRASTQRRSPRHQLTIRLLRDRGPRAISPNVTERAIGLAFAHHPSTCLSPSGGNLEAYAWSARILPGAATAASASFMGVFFFLLRLTNARSHSQPNASASCRTIHSAVG